MSKRIRRSLFWPGVRAFFWAWTPRLPFLRSRRFWGWSLGTFSLAFLSLAVGLNVLGAKRVDVVELVVMSLGITFPVQWVGMIIHDWTDRSRRERRGFAVSPIDEDEPERADGGTREKGI